VAVLVEGVSVIIKTQSIIDRYSGGWPAFRDNQSNETLCADGELIRVGFMTIDDTKQFVENLSEYNIAYMSKGKATDLVVADQQRGFAIPCDWAECGKVCLDEDPTKEIIACRMIGSKVDEIALPEGWNYENSLSHNFTFFESDSIPEPLEFVRHENGIDIYSNKKTGEEKYVGRTNIKK